MKKLDKIFMILLVSIVAIMGYLSRNTFDSISKEATQIVINQFVSSSKTISKAVQKDIFTGNYINAWKNTYLALKNDEKTFFMIQDKDGNDLVNDLDAQLKYEEVSSNSEWNVTTIDKFSSYQISKDNKHLIVTNSFLDERSGEVSSFKIIFAYDLSDLIKSSAGIRTTYFTFVMFSMGMIILYFFVIRRYFNRSFNSLISGVRVILSGQRIKDEETANTVDSYFEFKSFLRKFRAEFEETQFQLDIKAKEAALSELASQVAHDIRSPLAALDVAIQTDESMESDRKQLIGHSLDRIRNISEELLQKKRNTEKKLLNVEEIELSINNILKEKESRASENKVEVKLVSDCEDVKCKLLVNPVDLNRTISNLVNNSLDAVDDLDGKVTVNFTTRESEIEIEIRDNGAGMPTQVLEKIRESSFSWNKSKGNGLGLKFARAFAKRHGGCLKIDSTEGAGTSVTITLPFQRIRPENSSEFNKSSVEENEFRV